MTGAMEARSQREGPGAGDTSGPRLGSDECQDGGSRSPARSFSIAGCDLAVFRGLLHLRHTSSSIEQADRPAGDGPKNLDCALDVRRIRAIRQSRQVIGSPSGWTSFREYAYGSSGSRSRDARQRCLGGAKRPVGDLPSALKGGGSRARRQDVGSMGRPSPRPHSEARTGELTGTLGIRPRRQDLFQSEPRPGVPWADRLERPRAGARRRYTRCNAYAYPRYVVKRGGRGPGGSGLRADA